MQINEPKKKRSSNFNPRELTCLVDGVQNQNEILFSKLNNAVTNQRKGKIWEKITSEVNCLNTGGERSVKEIKTKWAKLLSECKLKAANINAAKQKTGGGPMPPELTDLESKVVSCLSNELIYGISGGADTSRTLAASVLESSESEIEENNVVPIDEFNRPSTSMSAVQIEHQLESTQNSQYQPLSTMSLKRKRSFSNKKQRKCSCQDVFIELETERIAIDKARLKVEEARLKIEEARLSTDNRIVELLNIFLSSRHQAGSFMHNFN